MELQSYIKLIVGGLIVMVLAAGILLWWHWQPESEVTQQENTAPQPAPANTIDSTEIPTNHEPEAHTDS